MTDQEVKARLVDIRNMLENGNSICIQPTNKNIELFNRLSESITEVERSKVTRGGLYVPLDEVQSMLRNIQRQIG